MFQSVRSSKAATAGERVEFVSERDLENEGKRFKGQATNSTAEEPEQPSIQSACILATDPVERERDTGVCSGVGETELETSAEKN